MTSLMQSGRKTVRHPAETAIFAVNISGTEEGERIGAEAGKLLIVFRRIRILPVAFCTLFDAKVLY
jgi:hypothetical protein